MLAGAGGTLAALLARPFAAFADDSIETHGLSSFGDLALPPDFPNFAYVNPQAPTGGLLSLQITGTSGNQNFDTFDTLNVYSWKGNGAAGMSATFDTLMTPNGDEPDSVYGLLAQSVRVSGDKLDYRFRLRPEARFFDGSRVTAADVAFSLNVLKEKGHPIYAQLLKEVESAAPEGDDVVHVRFVKDRSRDAHLIVVGMPVFSAAWWKDRDFAAATLDAPLGSGAYKVKAFEQGRFIEFERDSELLGREAAGQSRPEQFRPAALRILSRAAGRLRGVQGRRDQLSRGVHLTLLGDVLRLPRRQGRPRQEGDPAQRRAGRHAGLVSQHPPRAVQRSARPRGDRPRLRFRMDEQECDVFVLQADHLLFPEHRHGGQRQARPGRAQAARALPRQARRRPSSTILTCPRSATAPAATASLLKQAYDLLLSAGCKRDGSTMLLPNGKPLTIEFLDSSSVMQPHVTPFIQNLGKLGIQANLRIVDPAQLKSRTEAFDFDVVTEALAGSTTPGVGLRVVFTSEAAKQNGSRNLAGVADPVVDALIETIATAKSREELNAACRALDRVLRAGHYWVPMWYRDTAWVAYWDAFSRPERQPKLSTGAPGTWWWDEGKAKTIGL